jgi:tryptophan 2,3-dioxygenase
MTKSDPEGLKNALLTIYRDPKHAALHSLCERFIRLDEQLMLWRFRHVQMVERMIGMKRGTGGSLGVPYLQATLKKRFFPELWEIRTDLGGDY